MGDDLVLVGGAALREAADRYEEESSPPNRPWGAPRGARARARGGDGRGAWLAPQVQPRAPGAHRGVPRPRREVRLPLPVARRGARPGCARWLRGLSAMARCGASLVKCGRARGGPGCAIGRRARRHAPAHEPRHLRRLGAHGGPRAPLPRASRRRARALAEALLDGPLPPLIDDETRALGRAIYRGLGVRDAGERFKTLADVTARALLRRARPAVFSYHMGPRRAISRGGVARGAMARLRSVEAPRIVERKGGLELVFAPYPLPRGFVMEDHEARVREFGKAFVTSITGTFLSAASTRRRGGMSWGGSRSNGTDRADSGESEGCSDPRPSCVEATCDSPRNLLPSLARAGGGRARRARGAEAWP